MDGEFFKEYSEKHVHFVDLSVPEVLEALLRRLNEQNKQFSLIDLGCGDGRLLYTLHSKGMLERAVRVVGVDISRDRIERTRKLCPFAEGIVADVQNLEQISDNSFDVAISMQVIEHVPDDSRMLREAYRILKPNGYLYISTVVKKWYGLWIYYERGKGFKLDPTHVREYKSEEEFLELLKRNGFTINCWRTKVVSYPIIDLVLRALIKAGLVKPSPDFYLKHRTLRRLRSLKLRIIGYKVIEVVARVGKSAQIAKEIVAD